MLNAFAASASNAVPDDDAQKEPTVHHPVRDQILVPAEGVAVTKDRKQFMHSLRRASESNRECISHSREVT